MLIEGGKVRKEGDNNSSNSNKCAQLTDEDAEDVHQDQEPLLANLRHVSPRGAASLSDTNWPTGAAGPPLDKNRNEFDVRVLPAPLLCVYLPACERRALPPLSGERGCAAVCLATSGCPAHFPLPLPFPSPSLFFFYASQGSSSNFYTQAEDACEARLPFLFKFDTRARAHTRGKKT